MDFPAAKPVETHVTQAMAEVLGARPVRAWSGPYGAVQFEFPAEITGLQPDFRALGKVVLETDDPQYLPGTLAAFALGGDGVDVTSRFFAPGAGIDLTLDEDGAIGGENRRQ